MCVRKEDKVYCFLKASKRFIHILRPWSFFTHFPAIWVDRYVNQYTQSESEEREKRACSYIFFIENFHVRINECFYYSLALRIYNLPASLRIHTPSYINIQFDMFALILFDLQINEFPMVFYYNQFELFMASNIITERFGGGKNRDETREERQGGVD